MRFLVTRSSFCRNDIIFSYRNRVTLYFRVLLYFEFNFKKLTTNSRQLYSHLPQFLNSRPSTIAQDKLRRESHHYYTSRSFRYYFSISLSLHTKITQCTLFSFHSPPSTIAQDKLRWESVYYFLLYSHTEIE
jgi:hypothetical protein